MEAYRLKIMSLREVKRKVNRLKKDGKRVVFTNGCFDILHPGHVRYLFAARELGDYLIVAVNSDRSVKSIKGQERPVIPQDERTELLAAFEFVDAVFVFDEDDPLKVIEYLTPDILVKGGDWSEDSIIGSDIVKKAGGKVIRIPFVTGFSSSGIIEKIERMMASKFF